MGLIVTGGPCFQWCADNADVSPVNTGLSVGTSFTAGASSADDVSVTCLAALAADAYMIRIGIGGTATSTEDSNTLLDVLTDPAGGTSWSPIINDLVCGYAGTLTATLGISCWYEFPLWIKAGSSIGVRARRNSINSNANGRVHIQVYGKPKVPSMWWCGQAVESLGINAASSKGTTITPGNSSSFSAYATVGTSTKRYGALQFGVNGSDSSSLAIGYDWQLGIGSAQMPGTPTFYTCMLTTEQMWRSHSGILWCDVPASTTIQCRGTSSGTGEAHNVGVYGVY